MSWLLDSNVLAELRKGSRANPSVMAWFATTDEADLFTSVLVIGEARRGVESIRRRDAVAAQALEQWLLRLRETFADRVLPIDEDIAERWGALNVPDPVPAVDGLLAATALVHDLTVVTRNVRDMKRTGGAAVQPVRRVIQAGSGPLGPADRKRDRGGRVTLGAKGYAT